MAQLKKQKHDGGVSLFAPMKVGLATNTKVPEYQEFFPPWAAARNVRYYSKEQEMLIPCHSPSEEQSSGLAASFELQALGGGRGKGKKKKK